MNKSEIHIIIKYIIGQDMLYVPQVDLLCLNKFTTAYLNSIIFLPKRRNPLSLKKNRSEYQDQY